jgi:ribosomal protein L24E
MTAVRRRAALVVTIVALLGVGAASANAASPTIPANRPTPLAGATNGEVPRSRLINVIPHCTAAREAAPSLMRLFTMARQAGVGLAAEECYRTLANEVKFANIANQPGNNPACVASVGTSPGGKPVGHSMHGWGKATDLIDFGGSLTFSSRGYAFMKQNAWRVGWNHPAFAEPGGSSCPEPWHWEWVGDGGNLHLAPRRGDAVGLVPSADDRGFGVVSGLGAITPHGSFKSRGSAAKVPLQWVIVGATATPNRRGYWMVGADGGIFSYGDAKFHGSLGGKRLNSPINGMASSHSGKGYYLVAWDGGIFTFGDAKFRGSTGAMHLNKPVVGMTVTPSGRGYWLVASDGGIFTFGDAKFRGSTGNLRLVSPIVGMAPTPSGRGYWLVASDGGVFTFGDAKFRGALAQLSPVSPIVALVPTKSGANYRLLSANGRVSGPNDPLRHAVP